MCIFLFYQDKISIHFLIGNKLALFLAVGCRQVIKTVVAVHQFNDHIICFLGEQIPLLPILMFSPSIHMTFISVHDFIVIDQRQITVSTFNHVVCKCISFKMSVIGFIESGLPYQRKCIAIFAIYDGAIIFWMHRCGQMFIHYKSFRMMWSCLSKK